MANTQFIIVAKSWPDFVKIFTKPKVVLWQPGEVLELWIFPERGVDCSDMPQSCLHLRIGKPMDLIAGF